MRTIGGVAAVGLALTLLASCGSGQFADPEGTGSLAVQVIWPAGSTSAPTAQSLVVPQTAPPAVITMNATVTASGQTLTHSAPASAGSDSLSGIPVGPATLKLDALDSNNTVLYTGTTSVTVVANTKTPAIVTMGTAPGQTAPPWDNPGPYTVGGTISGLTFSGLVLRDNGGDDLTVSAGVAAFTFGTKVAFGAKYAVTVLTQPTGLICIVNSGTGTMGPGNVTNVNVVCSATGSITGTW